MKKASTGQIEFIPCRELGMEIVRGRDVVCPFGRHTHNSFCVGLIQQGSRIFACREKIYTVEPGQIFVIPPDAAHSIETSDGQSVSYLMFIIYPEILRKLTAQCHDKQAIMFEKFIIDSPALYREFVELYELLRHNEPVAYKEALLFQRVSDLLAMCAVITEQPLANCAKIEAVARIKNHLEVNYAANFSLTELAELVHLSPYYLIRVFTAQTGIPPHIYQRQIRIRHAKKLLAAGESIAAVAMGTGFYDQSHFARIFKHMLGITPGEYGRQVNLF